MDRMEYNTMHWALCCLIQLARDEQTLKKAKGNLRWLSDNYPDGYFDKLPTSQAKEPKS